MKKNILFRCICVILVFCMLFLVASCSKETETDENPSQFSSFGFGSVVVSPQESIYYDVVDSYLDGLKTYSQRNLSVSANHVTFGYDDKEYMHSSGKAIVDIKNSLGFPFADWCARNSVNPFEAFNTINDLGIIYGESLDSIDKNCIKFEFTTGAYPYQYLNALETNVKPQKFEFSREGCVEFIDALIELSSKNEGTCQLFEHNRNLPTENLVHYDDSGNIYYCDIIVYNTSHAYLFTLEMESSDSKHIDMINFDLGMFIYPFYDCAAGIGISESLVEDAFDFEAISLLSSIELLFTGETSVSDLEEPINHNDQTYFLYNNYKVKDYSVYFHKNYFVTAAFDIADFSHLDGKETFIKYSYEIYKNK